MKQKLKKLLITVVIMIMCILLCNINYTFADFGDFESYDSGSSWDSGHSSSSSDWGSSSSGYYSSGNGEISLGGTISFIIILVIIIAITNKKGKAPRNYNIGYTPERTNTISNELEIERQVKAIDELFNKEEFNAWSKDIFIKMQNSWMNRDLETLRVLFAKELFEQHKIQIQGYIDRGQINVLERICVLSCELMEFNQVGGKDILSVRLKSRMNDYIIDEKTKAVIKGDKNENKFSTYKLTFIRNTGIKTKPGESTISTTNCPNCGAPTQITSTGKCEYCGSVITTSEHNWVLSGIQKISY